MPCDTVRNPNQSLEQRNDQVKSALSRLEASLKAGRVKVTIGPTGGVAFTGWKDRDDVTDVCAVRTLMAQNSWELRQAIARAEAQSGRKMNPQAVAAGHHAHDGKWHKGH
jgi:hypothetical protein